MLLGFCIMMFWAYVLMYFLCEFGENVTKEFNNLDDTFFELNWYLFPFEIQRRLPITIAAIQQPVVLEGFVNCAFTREAFKKVCIVTAYVS